MDNAYTDQRLAVDLAADAGQLLVELRTSGPSGRELGDLGDRDANTLLLDRLAAERPGDAVLSEESGDDLARVDADRVWIIDPVDGTREYGMGDRPDWAVHVALWERSGDPARARLTAAAVSLPALGVVLGTDGDEQYAPPTGHSGVPGGGLLPPRAGDRPRIVLSAPRPPAFAPASPPLRCRCRRSVWCWGPTATSSTPRRPDTRACPAAGCSRPGTATGHGSCCPPPARRRSRTRSPTRSAGIWSHWVRPAPRPPRWCAGRPTPTSTPGASTSGTPRRPPEWHWPGDSSRCASTGTRSDTTWARSTSPTWWSAARTSPTPCWGPSPRWRDPGPR